MATTGVLAALNFNQGIAFSNNAAVNTITDASGFGNTFTLNNFTLAGGTSNWVAPGGVTTGNSCTPVNTVIYYADTDGDMYGNPLVQVNLGDICTAPSGYVLNNTDCDDNNASINPAALDICDGIDNNCNGTLDDNNSLNFDGANDYVQMNDFNLGTSDFTVEAWVNPESNGNFVMGNRTVESTGTGNWWIIRTDNNHLVLEMGQSTAPSYS